MRTKDSLLLAWIDRAIERAQPTQIRVSGFGSISVYPEQRLYASDIKQWESVPFNDGNRLRVGALVWNAPPDTARPIGELQWKAMLYFATTWSVAPPPLQVVCLRQWPELADIPEEYVPAVVRICALLARRPAAIGLIARLVGMPERVVSGVVEVLMHNGYVAALQTKEADPSGSGSRAAETQDEPMPDEKPSLAARLWQRLLGR